MLQSDAHDDIAQFALRIPNCHLPAVEVGDICARPDLGD